MIRIISDIHLEFHKGIKPFISWMNGLPKTADTLVLAGDVCTFRTQRLLCELLDGIAMDYQDIIYVLGNHEYYYSEYSHPSFVIDSYRSLLAKYPNVTLLENETMVTRSGIKIWGSTLWSNIDPVAFRRMSDSAYLPHELYLKKHTTAIKELESLADKSVDLIVTHHMPSYRLIHKRYLRYGTSMQSAFASEADAYLQKTKSAWVYGHTHAASTNELEGVTCICNPCGYPGENDPWWNDYTFSV